VKPRPLVSRRARARGRHGMSLPAAVVLLLFVLAAPAFAAEKVAMFSVRLTTEASVLSGCEVTGRVSDSSMEDLRKKIVRSGGNAGLLMFDSLDLEKVHADVYRCHPAPK
jgi:hypothetical protein